MKQVIKVSIGNMAFTLEEDAHGILNDYLSALNSHYSGNPSGQEIVDGIEERIAELLIEKCGKGGIVPAQTVREVIAIVGKPEDIDGDGESSGSSSGDSRYSDNVRRKLYRDTANQVIGGVCSGFAAYFKQDTLLFRVLFVIFAIGFSIFGWHFGGIGFMVLLYLVLWMVIPPAITTEQKCAMKGESVSFQDIQKNVENGAARMAERAKEAGNSDFFRVFGRVMGVFFGIIFTIVGLVGVASCIVAFFGFQFWGCVIPLGIMESISIFSGSAMTTWLVFRILVALVIFLPFLGILYGGIQMLFDFRSPRWRPGLVIFILWVISVLGLFGMCASMSSSYWDNEEKETSSVISPVSDTIYVQFADVEKWKNEKISVDADRDDYKLFFIDNSDKENSKVILYPKFKLDRDDYNRTPSIEAKSNIFDGTMSMSELSESAKLNFYSFDGKTLTLDPMILDKENPLKEIDRKVTLNVGENVTVIVKEPIYHAFDRSFNYSNMKFFKYNKRNKDYNLNFDFDF